MIKRISLFLIIFLGCIWIIPCAAQEREYADENIAWRQTYYPSPHGVYKDLYVQSAHLVVDERPITAYQDNAVLFVNAGRESRIADHWGGFSSAIRLQGLLRLNQSGLTINNAHYQANYRWSRGRLDLLGGCMGGDTPEEAAKTAPGGRIKFNGVYDNENNDFSSQNANVIFRVASTTQGAQVDYRGISYRIRYDPNSDNKRCFNGYYEAAIVRKDTENYYVPVDPETPPPGISLWRICVRHADSVPLWNDNY